MSHEEFARIMMAGSLSRREMIRRLTGLGIAAPVAAEEIIAYCRENMAHYKIPKTVVFGPLPKTSTGKIQKFVLRDTAGKL